MKKELDRKLDRKLDKKFDSCFEKKLDEKKKLDGKIGRAKNKNWTEFPTAYFRLRCRLKYRKNGEIIVAEEGPPPERRQIPQIERGGDAHMKWIRMPPASPPCFGRQAGQWQALITPPTSEIAWCDDTTICIIHVHTIYVSCVGW